MNIFLCTSLSLFALNLLMVIGLAVAQTKLLSRALTTVFGRHLTMAAPSSHFTLLLLATLCASRCSIYESLKNYWTPENDITDQDT
jgi:formate-dependent phosphoribosylglycinamide formyltransferase (GAR transformylase)